MAWRALKAAGLRRRPWRDWKPLEVLWALESLELRKERPWRPGPQHLRVPKNCHFRDPTQIEHLYRKQDPGRRPGEAVKEASEKAKEEEAIGRRRGEGQEGQKEGPWKKSKQRSWRKPKRDPDLTWT